eukprot:scaffold1691_cov107-Isochrysis_galbana.AAC.17
MPSISARSCALRRREASCSPAAPRGDSSASISSKKSTAGAWWRAKLKRVLASFSLSPGRGEARVERAQCEHAWMASVCLRPCRAKVGRGRMRRWRG